MAFGIKAKKQKTTTSPESTLAQDITQLNAQIAREGERVQAAYARIGKLYAEKHRKDYEPEFAEDMASVFQSEAQILEYWKRIQDAKGVVCCEHCGAEISNKVPFCCQCGHPTRAGSAAVLCPQCGTPLREGVRFCTGCGTPIAGKEPVPEPMAADECPQCASSRRMGLNFCTGCGKSVSGKLPAVPSEPIPEPAAQPEALEEEILPDMPDEEPSVPQPPAPEEPEDDLVPLPDDIAALLMQFPEEMPPEEACVLPEETLQEEPCALPEEAPQEEPCALPEEAPQEAPCQTANEEEMWTLGTNEEAYEGMFDEPEESPASFPAADPSDNSQLFIDQNKEAFETLFEDPAESVPRFRLCPNCRKQLPESARFCTECGTRL